ncbi:NADP oxidoreductase [Streptomyces sp. NPDC087658]|uniref:NADP oxidoreductase n=1 Tax=Streptomyces sp. NPDC087658 TaxID=3365800 RepID=UPI0038027103
MAEPGPRARAATPDEAAAAGDWVVVSVPLKHYLRVPVAPLAGKAVLDTHNYPERDGRIAELDTEEVTTGELLQRRLPDAHVIKAFNNIYFKHLAAPARPSGAPDRSAPPLAGDDAAAKAAAIRLFDLLGYDASRRGPPRRELALPAGRPALCRPVREGPAGARHLAGRSGCARERHGAAYGPGGGAADGSGGR